MKKLRFFKCNTCGNVVVKLIEKGVPVFCCGEQMQELVANTVDAAAEKHVPVFSLKNGLLDVCVGEVEHPMQDVHFINFVAVETDKGYKIVSLNPNDKPRVTIYMGDEKVKVVYEYCNLHGLWKAESKN